MTDVEKKIDPKVQKELDNIKILWMGGDIIDEAVEYEMDYYIKGELQVTVELKYLPTDKTWIDIYTVTVKGYPINFRSIPDTYYDAFGDPGEPGYVDWDDIEWITDELFSRVDYEDTKGEAPNYSDDSGEVEDSLGEKVADLVLEHLDELLSGKVVTF